MAEMIYESEQAKTIDTGDLLKDLHVDPKIGLDEKEISTRRDKFGFNEIVEKKESLLLRFLKNFWGPIPWMIEAAVILSIIDKDWKDVIIIGSLLLINALIEFVQSYKADNAMAMLKKSLASKARVLREGRWHEMEARELLPGDIIRIRLGDIIPADVKLLDGEYLIIDESALTGESLPVEKYAGDIAFSGSIAKQGEMNAVVYGTALNTFFGKTAKLVAEAKTKSHFQKAVIRIGDYLIILNFILVLIVILSGLFRQERLIDLLQFALVLTVASIPAALPAVLSVTMAVGALKLSRKKAIIRKLVAVEEMAGMDILCSDKTGTITQNKLSVKGLHPIGNYSEDDILIFGAMASKAENNDPLDNAVLELAEKNSGLWTKITSFVQKDFKPFDPVSKRTEALIDMGSNEIKVSKGAPQMILELLEDKGSIQEEMENIVKDAGTHGYRTLGVARTNEAGKWQYVGLIALNDPPREDSAETIRQAQEMGVKVEMITGDHTAIAIEIAQQVNIGKNIIPASEFVDLPDRKAKDLIEKSDGFSQVFPEHKYEIVQLLQENNHIVGMTGDGVNDAPALKKADAGIAVDGATDAAKSAADIVLTKPGLSVIVDAIKESRQIFQRMQSYAIYRISETIDVLFFTVLAILFFREYPVTAVMIVMLAVFNDFPIMTIAYDKVRYAMKPESWNMRKVISIASVLGFTNVLFTFGMFYLGKHYFKMEFEQVQTLVFAELAIAGNLTIFLARTSGPLWSIAPGKGLVWSTLLSKILVSLICAFGWIIAPIGWYVLFVWAYAIVQMLITDRVKLLAYKVFDHSGLRFAN